MKKEKCIILILLVIIIILIGSNINFILQKNSIVKNNKQTIKEMNESTQITDLNNQINALNTEHTDYMNYIQTCKATIASVLTNEGVETFENETFGKMAENIGNIFSQRTKLDESVAATADNISEGKQAYVNGELITGTGGAFSSNKFEMVASDTTGDSNRTISYTATEDCYLIGFTECESRCMRTGQNYTSSSISLSVGCENLYKINKHNSFAVSGRKL